MSGVGFVIFVLWIAVSNLMLGFALAVFMGHGPRRFPQLSLAIIPRLTLPTFKLSFLRRRKPEDEPEATAQEAPAKEEAPTATTRPADDGISLDEALVQFQLEVADVRGSLDDAAQRVQACAEAPTVEGVEECVADLKSAGHRILDGRAESLRSIELSSDGSEAQQKAVGDMQQAAADQAKDILQALDEIDQLEIRPETLEADCQRLKNHTDSLAATCDTMSQSIEAAKTEPASQDSPETEHDDTAEVHLERVEASEALDDWWADDPDHQRLLTMVMIDLDGTGKLNQAIGEQQVDALLAKVEEVILQADIHGGRASQINTQRFLLLLPKVEMPKLTREVEQLREQIGSLAITSEDCEAQLTASCAIACSQAGDSARALVDRTEAALLEAKQFGGNRTFLNEGEFPTPVVGSSRPETAAAM